MSEQTYSTAQIANLLKLTRAMVNKYALAVEEFQGQKISQTAKDGRQFSTEDYKVIANAKFLVDSERVTLNTAVKMSLGQSELIPTASSASLVGIDTSQALEAIVEDNRAALVALVASNQANTELLLQALKPEVSQPIIDELQALRRELAQLKDVQMVDKVTPTNNVPATSSPAAGKPKPGGIRGLIRRWLDGE